MAERSARCFVFHDWDKWSDPAIARLILNGAYAGTTLIQQRTCKRCGKVQQTRISGS